MEGDDDHDYTLETPSTTCASASSSRMTKISHLKKSLVVSDKLLKSIGTKNTALEEYYAAKMDFMKKKVQYMEKKLNLQEKK